MTILRDKIKHNIEFCCEDNISQKDKDLLLALIMDVLRITFEGLTEDEE